MDGVDNSRSTDHLRGQPTVGWSRWREDLSSDWTQGEEVYVRETGRYTESNVASLVCDPRRPGGNAWSADGCFCLVSSFLQVNSRILLLPPKSTVELRGNPYLGLSGLKQPVDVLVRALTSQEAALEVEQRWPSATYVVEPDYTTNGPILVITVEDSNPEVALDATAYLLDQAPKTLDDLQAGLGVRPNSRITSTVITRDAVPEPVRKSQLRALVVALGAGVTLTALAAAAVDGLLRQRRRPPVAEADVAETDVNDTQNGRRAMAQADVADPDLDRTDNGRP